MIEINSRLKSDKKMAKQFKTVFDMYAKPQYHIVVVEDGKDRDLNERECRFISKLLNELRLGLESIDNAK